MPGLNKVQLIGRLGKDPELRTLNNGQTVANFSLATSEEWKDRTTGEKKQLTEWHNLVVWGPLATICNQYLHKGSQAYFSGKLRTRSWEKDGVTRYITEVFVDDMLMLDTKQGNGSGAPPITQNPGHTAAPGAGTSAPATQYPTDDLPF